MRDYNKDFSIIDFFHLLIIVYRIHNNDLINFTGVINFIKLCNYYGAYQDILRDFNDQENIKKVILELQKRKLINEKMNLGDLEMYSINKDKEVDVEALNNHQYCQNIIDFFRDYKKYLNLQSVNPLFFERTGLEVKDLLNPKHIKRRINRYKTLKKEFFSERNNNQE